MSLEKKLLDILKIPADTLAKNPKILTETAQAEPEEPATETKPLAPVEKRLEHFEGDMAEADPDITPEQVEKKKVIVVRDTALDLDLWDIKRGAECFANSEELKKAFPNRTGKGDQEYAEKVIADMHAIAYTMDPRLVEQCTDPRRREYIEKMLQTPEVLNLRQSTVLNDLAAEMAATSFGVEYGVLVQADKEREKKFGEGAKKPNPERNELQKQMGLQRAVSKAVSKAKEDVGDLDNAMRGLGGDGSTTNNPQEAKRIADIYKRIKKNRTLQEIFNRAGKFRMMMQSAQRRKVKHGTDDTVGVELGGDVHRLLPVELAQLADEDYELDAMRRLIDNQAMCRLYQGTETVAKGPIVVCVDESGSMSGDPIWNAKAFALAMASLAKTQNRWCCLIGYAGATEGVKLVLKPGKWDQLAVLTWLEHFYSGGTDMDIPLAQLPAWWGTKELEGLPVGKTDLILITDAIVNVPLDMEQKFNIWKKANQVKTISLIIGNEPGDLKRVSDECHKVKGISVDETGVVSAMSI